MNKIIVCAADVTYRCNCLNVVIAKLMSVNKKKTHFEAISQNCALLKADLFGIYLFTTTQSSIKNPVLL